MTIQIEQGCCYLVEEKKPLASFRLFKHLLAENVPGLCVSRLIQPKVRERYGLPSSSLQIWWIAETPGEGHYGPYAMVILGKAIQKFIEDEGGKGVILIDGLETLIQYNGFQQTQLTFVEHLNEFVMSRRAVVLFPFSRATLDQKELATLERSLEVIDGDDLNRQFDTDDLSRRLG